MRMINFLSDFLRKRRGKSLAFQIEKLHPELDEYLEDDKINRYALLACRFFPAQRDLVLGPKPIFNELVADAHPELLEEVLTYLSPEKPAYYHRQAIELTIQNQDLNQLVKEQKELIDSLTYSRDLQQKVNQKAIEILNEQTGVIRQSVDPNTRLN